MRLLLLTSIALLLGSPLATAAFVSIDSVSAGTSGSPPNLLQSVTVGGYTANRSDLRAGTTEALVSEGDSIDFFGTWPPPYASPAPSSTFDIHTFLGKSGNTNPVRVTSFGGQTEWTDINGSDPDFFMFESVGGTNGDTGVTIQAILPGNVLGTAVDVPNTGTWGDTGIVSTNGQPIKGVSFHVTDLKDDSGSFLIGSAAIEGLQINSPVIDLALVAAVGIPEPASSLLALISLCAMAGCRRW